jgi:hypothetical protein
MNPTHKETEMYNPRIGKWLSADPIGFDGKDVNLYRYVGNALTHAADPMGLREEESDDTGPPTDLNSEIPGFWDFVKNFTESIKETPWEMLNEEALNSAKAIVQSALSFSDIHTFYFSPAMVGVRDRARETLRIEMMVAAKNPTAIDIKNHYLDGNGQDYEIEYEYLKTIVEGTDAGNRYVSPRLLAEYQEKATLAGNNPGTSISLGGEIDPLKWNDGAIMKYKIELDGVICTPSGAWRDLVWTGKVGPLDDDFDLDPYWSWSEEKEAEGTNSRGRWGERALRIGYILDLGNDFHISSVVANGKWGFGDNHVTVLSEAEDKLPWRFPPGGLPMA